MASKSTQYDNIGKLYSSLKSLPSERIQRYGVRSALPQDVSQLKVLDLACGSGYYARLLVEWGVQHVTAIDVSKEMIAEAQREQSKTSSIGAGKVDFHVADCSKDLLGAVPDLKNRWGQYDVVLGAWFLNYAPDGESLKGMWQNISGALRPGGTFIGLIGNRAWEVSGKEWHTDKPPQMSDGNHESQNQNPQSSASDSSSKDKPDKYGTSARKLQTLPNGLGSKILITAHTSPTPFSFAVYSLNWKIHEESRNASGMEHVSFNVPRMHDIPKEALAEDGDEEWWWEFFEGDFGPTWCVWVCRKRAVS